MEEGLSFGMIYGATLAYYPAMLVIISIAVLLIGVVPKLTGFIWLYVFYSFIVLYLGGIFQFPEWVGNLSPYGHVPQIPVEEMNLVPIVVLTIIAISLLVIGCIGYSKRDIES